MKTKKQLTQKETGKILNLTLLDKDIISESGKADKLKSTEKSFDNQEQALKEFTKKEWEALKKGFILNNQEAQPGEANLHLFIGGGYTGCLSFEQTPVGIFVYKNEKNKDLLNLINESGEILETIELPKQLAWNIEYRAETNSLLLDIDHFVFEYSIDNKTFDNIGEKQRDHTSFVSVEKNKTAFATDNKIFLSNNYGKILQTMDYKYEIVQGTTPFCGKLSKNGKLLAFHNKMGEIQIIDSESGKVLNTLTGDFSMIDQMEFAENDRLLAAREKYGTWSMRYLDLSTNKEIKFNDLAIPSYSKDVNCFCFNEDQSKLVLVQRSDAYVFDFNSKKFLYSFKIEHIVKGCNIKFIGDKLGVRTDYGCFSIYNL